jgi:two-component system NtrC family sensor kinase
MSDHSASADIPLLTSRITALEQLLEVYENTMIKQADKLYEEIAEHKRAEEDIRRLNETLEQKVEQLLEAQEELVRKKKLAILGQFSGSVGHELRNPLGVMNNAVYFLKTVLADADESIKEYLGIIKQEIDNSQRIISDLLDFSRTKTPQAHAVQVHDLILQTHKKCAIPENIQFQADLPAMLPRIQVDPLQMMQVFLNLIANAVQAMADGGALCVAARRVSGFEFAVSGSEPESREQQPETGDFVEISVSDTGGGISPDNLKKLFQPLFTTRARGVGLGLVVCRNLTEANGGRIEVESRLGAGTTFKVTLPVAEKKP